MTFVYRYTRIKSVVFSILITAVLGLASERKSWDVIRFLQQSSRFTSFPFIGKKLSVPCDVDVGDILWTATDPKSKSFTMAPLDDVVMGGVSSSKFDANTGTWTGSVTDANNGGFIGIRSTPSFEWNMERCVGLEWKIRSFEKSVKRFKFVVRDSTEFNGVTWTTSVDVFPGTNTVRILFNKQIPARFAKTLTGKAFQKANVCGVQIAFSKFEYDGKFNPKFELGNVKIQLLQLKAI